MAKVVAFGDSLIGPLKLFDKHVITVVKYKGATAQGLINMNSFSGAGQNIHELCQNFSSTTRCLLFIFGNVDVHITLYHKLIDNPLLNIDEYLESCVSKYSAYLRQQVTGEHIPTDTAIAVCSVIQPVVAPKYLERCVTRYTRISHDEDRKSKLHKLLSDNPHFSSLEFREQCVHKFNKLLKRECYRNSFHFIDINDGLLDRDGQISTQYRDESKVNIHICWEPTIELWQQRLEPYGVSVFDIPTNLEKTLATYKQNKSEKLESYYLNHPDEM